MYKKPLHFHNIFADANARYNVSQNIDSMHVSGSTIYSLFTYASTLYLLIYAFDVRIKERLIQMFYVCVEFSIHLHKYTH